MLTTELGYLSAFLSISSTYSNSEAAVSLSCENSAVLQKVANFKCLVDSKIVSLQFIALPKCLFRIKHWK